GLVNHVVAHDELLPTARALALDIAGVDQHAIRTLLGSIRRIAGADGEDAALAIERETSRAWAQSLDPSEVGARRAAVMERARARAIEHRVSDRCRFAVVDLDDGLPDGPAADVIVCHLFRDPRLDAAIVERLAPGGLLAVAALSEVGAAPGSFRVPQGGLVRAFAAREVVAAREGGGAA